MRMWFPRRECLTKLPLLSSPTPLALLPLNLAQQFRDVKRLKMPGGSCSLPGGMLGSPPLQMCPRRLGWEGSCLCVRPAWGHRELLLGQGPFRFLIWLPLPTLHRTISRWLRAALWQEKGSWSITGAGPRGGPERGGTGEEGSASLHLSCHPLPPLLPDGAIIGWEEGRKPQGAATGLTSCLIPEKGKISYAEFTASAQVGVGAGQDGSQLYGVDGFPLHVPPATHLALIRHSVRG